MSNTTLLKMQKAMYGIILTQHKAFEENDPLVVSNASG